MMQLIPSSLYKHLHSDPIHWAHIISFHVGRVISR